MDGGQRVEDVAGLVTAVDLDDKRKPILVPMAYGAKVARGENVTPRR
jgi:hypothetical protein